MKSDRLLAVGEGLLVCVIWASSFVIVKLALAHIGPLALAGMRYFAAFLLLLPLMARRGELTSDPAPGHWWHLAAIGVCAYAIGNGTLYWGLQYLPATTGSFLLTLIPVGVLLLGILRLKEVPTGWQVVGLVVALGGGALFFSPGLRAGELRAAVVVGAGLLAFAVFGVLGREVARTGRVATLCLTAIPLGIGGGLALIVALVVEGLPSVSSAGWAIVLWLAAVNTAVAYLLYNHSLRTLTALEMNVILNLSPLGTAVLAAYLLHERVTAAQWVGIVVLILGVCVVQWGGWRASKMEKVESYG